MLSQVKDKALVDCLRILIAPPGAVICHLLMDRPRRIRANTPRPLVPATVTRCVFHVLPPSRPPNFFDVAAAALIHKQTEDFRHKPTPLLPRIQVGQEQGRKHILCIPEPVHDRTPCLSERAFPGFGTVPKIGTPSQVAFSLEILQGLLYR